MKKKFLSLPKNYLSYSQYSLWLSNPTRYKQVYFDGRNDGYVNRGQVFGKTVADALESGRETDDLLTDAAMLLLPKYDVQDELMEVEVKTKYGWLNLVAKPDTFNSMTHEFKEYKTGLGGIARWTARRAQNHLQMWFYAVVIWHKFGTILSDAQLVWIETERVDGETRPTGHVETFDVRFSKAELMSAFTRIVKAAHEIEVAWASHVTRPWITTF